jgi:hypothetical protein
VRLGIVIVAAIAILVVGVARAAPPDAAPASAPTVTSYPPSFFAGVRPDTALDMIYALPGFALDTGGGVRGFGGAAGNVLIDGDRPATKNDSLDQILQRIPADTVIRIDVIRGGAPGIDMQGKTVIANVIRRANTKGHLTIGLQDTALWNGLFLYGLRLEGDKRIGDVLFEGSLLVGTGADDGAGNGPHTVSNAAGVIVRRDKEHYFGKAESSKFTGATELPLLGGNLRVEGSYLANPYGSLNRDISPLAAARQTELFSQDQNVGEVGVRYTRGIGSKLHLELYGLQQLSNFAEFDSLDTPFDISLFKLGKHQGESILRGEVTHDIGRNVQVRSSLEGDYNWLTSHTAESDHGLPVLVPAANVHVTELRGEAATDLTWKVKPDLVLEAGIRAEASRLASTGDVVASQSFFFPKPRIVLTWSPNADHQLQLHVEREVSQLDFGNFTAQGSLGSGEHAGNPQLSPQQDWMVEATFDRHFWKGGDLNIALRQFWLQDVIDFAPACRPPVCPAGAEFDAPANIGSGVQRAVAVALTLPTDKLLLKNGQLVLRATWRMSHVIDPSTHSAREISGLHPFDAEAHFTQGLPSWKSTWGFDVFPAYRQTEFHFSEIDTQRLGLWVDIYFEYKPRPDLSLRIEGDNLTSHGLRQVRAFFDPFRDQGGGKLTSIDDRDPHFGPELSVRVRKTFG